jgi:hypothetical protein
MSRSYKKHPVCKDSANQEEKRIANKKVRHTLNIPSGGSYKKCYESWNISDWCWRWTKEEAIRDWEKAQEDPDNSWISSHFETLEQYLQYWEKCTKRK